MLQAVGCCSEYLVRKSTIFRNGSTNDNLSAGIRVMWPVKIICLVTSRDPGPLECSALSIERNRCKVLGSHNGNINGMWRSVSGREVIDILKECSLESWLSSY